MKKLPLLFTGVIISTISFSQFTYKIKADSLLVTNDSCNAELNLENGTRNVLGFMYNKGNGRTEFRKGLIKLNDSLYIIGNDTLNIAKGIVSGDYIRNQNTAAQPANFWVKGNNIRIDKELRIAGDNLTGSDEYLRLGANDLNFIRRKAGETAVDYKAQNQHRFYNDNAGADSYVFGTSQAGSVLINTQADVPASVLTVASTSKGWLKPRMSLTQRDAIASPVAGLEIYNTTTKTMDYHNGTAWVSGSYILNQNAVAQPANFNIGGTGAISSIATTASGSGPTALNIVNRLTDASSSADLRGIYVRTEHTGSGTSHGIYVAPYVTGNASLLTGSWRGISIISNFDGAIGSHFGLALAGSIGNQTSTSSFLIHSKGGTNSIASYFTQNAVGTVTIGKAQSIETDFPNSGYSGIRASLYVSSPQPSNSSIWYNTATGVGGQYASILRNSSSYDLTGSTSISKGALRIMVDGAFSNTPGNATAHGILIDVAGADKNWAIFSRTGKNYFADNVLIGAATDNGNKLQVTGDAYINGKQSIGTTASNALLHLGAGTATTNTAPLKFTSGTNLTTPENGAVEYDGTNYFATAGNTRYTLAKTMTATVTLDFSSTPAQSSSNLTVTITGAADGDAVSLGVPNTSVNDNSSFSAWISAADTVTVRFNNYSSGAINPASGTFRVSIVKY
jgi:hypothetical protein